MNRKINNLVLHCTATPQSTTPESILRFWKEVNKWKKPGYHFLILPDGTILNLLPIEEVSNGVAGHNSDSIHISYIGGIDKKGKAIDNRTDAQKTAQICILKDLKKKFPNAEIRGHRDFLVPGSAKWKECPSFDVKTWAASVMDQIMAYHS